MIKRLTSLTLACILGLALASTLPIQASAATASPDKWQDQLRKLNEKLAGGKLSSSCVPKAAITRKMRAAYRLLGRSRGCVPRALEPPLPAGRSAITAWSYSTSLRGHTWCLVNTMTPAAPAAAVVGLAVATRHCAKHAWAWVTWPGDVRPGIR
jgi:hypothetical protein